MGKNLLSVQLIIIFKKRCLKGIENPKYLILLLYKISIEVILV